MPTPFRIGDVNAYLLEGDPLTLVDTGPRWSETELALDAALAAHGHRVEDVELVVLTHQHHDHVGLAGTVRRRSGAAVAAVADLAAHLADYDAAMDADDAYATALMRRHGTSAETIATLNELSVSFRRFAAGVAVDRVLTPGELLTAGGRRWRVHARPGHSPTDTIFHDESDGALLGGDHLLARISSNPVAHVAPGAPDPAALAGAPDRPRPLVAYAGALRQTAAMAGVRLVLPGHGAPFGDVAGLVGQRIELHERRMDKILAEVDGRRTATDIGRLLWRQVPVTEAYLVLSEVLGHLDLLAERGAVAEHERDGVVRYSASG